MNVLEGGGKDIKSFHRNLYGTRIGIQEANIDKKCGTSQTMDSGILGRESSTQK